MAIYLPILLLGCSLHASSPQLGGIAAAAPPAQLATYVPVCKNSHGVFDRRACGNKNDPRRSQVA